MSVDTVIRNGRLVSPEGTIRAGIAIKNEKIVAVSDDRHFPEAEKVIDADGRYVLPGIIDVHVHIGLYHPFEEEKRDIASAAYGGTTTVGNYVGGGVSAPAGSYEESFYRWKDDWEKGSLVDAVFHGIILTGKAIKEIKHNAESLGITSNKFFMVAKGENARRMGADPADDGFLWTAFREVAALGPGARAMVHAENSDMIDRILPHISATGRQEIAAWDDARPGFCETIDVMRAISLARLTGTPLYVVHTSHADSVDAIGEAKAAGVDVICETCPQYLVLNRNSDLGPLGVINPPLRDEASQERLWRGLREGTVDCIGSDHCSTTKETKQDLWKSPPGAPGLGFLLPLLLSEGVGKGRLTIEKLVEICCRNNAKALGIYPQKGTLQVGSDADLVIVDMDKKVKIDARSVHYALTDFTPYEGMEVTGWPVLTMLRGEVLMEEGKLRARPGWGRYIARSLGQG